MTAVVQEIPVVTMVCDEPDGPVTRSVYPMPLSIENLKAFWDHARLHKVLFMEEVNDDFRKFAELFISQDENGIRAHGLFWVIDDYVGVYYMTHLTPTEADAHYTFFDGRQKGRGELTKEMLRYAFRRYGFWRINVNIPMFVSKHAHIFVESLGFVREGRKRKAVMYKGQRFDVASFGLLREEIL